MTHTSWRKSVQLGLAYKNIISSTDFIKYEYILCKQYIDKKMKSLSHGDGL